MLYTVTRLAPPSHTFSVRGQMQVHVISPKSGSQMVLDVRTVVPLWGWFQGLKCSIPWSECQLQVSVHFVTLHQNSILGELCVFFFFFFFVCMLCLHKKKNFKLLPNTTTTKKKIEICASQVLFHKESPQWRIGHLSNSCVLTGIAGFTNSASFTGNLGPVHWKLLLSHDWGRFPDLGSFSPPGSFPSSRPSCTWATSLTRRKPRAETKAWRLGPLRRWTHCHSS